MISYLMMMMGMVRMMELNKLLLLTLLFLLYHICCHSFLKSCYLKKCFHFCVLSLFSFFSAFKTGRHLANVTYLSEGVVWPPASRGRHAEMQRQALQNFCPSMNKTGVFAHLGVWRVCIISGKLLLCLLGSQLAGEALTDKQSCLIIQDQPDYLSVRSDP